MLKKIILLPFMLCLIVLSVNAYEIGDVIRINGEYRESGILTASNSTIHIYLPNEIKVVNNVTMTPNGTGLSYYDYTIPDSEGIYTATIQYYKNDVYQGNESALFTVGNINTLSWNVCPTGTQGWVGMWIFLIILIVLALFGYMAKNSILTVAAGIFMMLTSFFTFGCGEILGYASIFIGLIFLLIGASIRS